MTRAQAPEFATRWGWVAVVAVALSLRLPHICDRSIWYDEASSWRTARYGWVELWRSILLNVHLPLYYVLLKGWMSLFGESAAAIRGLSVMFGVVTALSMGLFGRELFRSSTPCQDDATDDQNSLESRTFGLVVAMLVSLSPVQVFASIEARMYTMGTAFTALSGWLLLRNLRTGGGAGWWAAYGLSILGLLYSHHYGLFSVAAQAAFLGAYVFWLVVAGEEAAARRLLVTVAFVGIVATLAYLPALGILRAQTQHVQQDYWIRALDWETFCATFSQFVVPDHDDVPRPYGWLVIGLVAAASMILLRDGRRGEGFVVSSSLLPLAFSASASVITPVWVGRYFRFAHLFVLATIALAAWRITRRRPPLLAGMFVCMAAGLLYANVIFWDRLDLPRNRGMQAAVASIVERIRPGESIVSTEVVQYVTAKFYVGTRAPIYLLEPPNDMSWGWHLIRPDDVISLDEFRHQAARGVWLVSTIPVPVISPDWDWGERMPTEQGHFHYYLSLHRDIYVHYYKYPDDELSGVGAGRGTGD